MLLRPHALLLLALVSLPLAGCHAAASGGRWSARNRPVAAASPAYIAGRSARPVTLGAGDSLGQAVFSRYAQWQQSQPAMLAAQTGRQAVPSPARARPPIIWREPLALARHEPSR